MILYFRAGCAIVTGVIKVTFGEQISNYINKLISEIDIVWENQKDCYCYTDWYKIFPILECRLEYVHKMTMVQHLWTRAFLGRSNPKWAEKRN